MKKIEVIWDERFMEGVSKPSQFMELNPKSCIGFQNIVIQISLNNLKNKYAEADGSIDICGIFDRWLQKVITFKQLCLIFE